MSWKPAAWLLAGVLMVGLFIAIFERGSRPMATGTPIDEPLLALAIGNVTNLTVSLSNTTFACALRGQGWVLLDPVETRADAARIREVLEALQRTRRREILTPETRLQRGLSLESFGLDRPRIRCLVGGGQRQDDIVLGTEAPLGDLVYGRLNGGDDVLVLTRDFEQALPQSIDDMRDRAVFPASVASAARIEIKHAGGFIQLALRGKEWRLQQPLDGRADDVVVEWLIKLLKGLRIESFGNPLLGADSVAYGFGADDAVLQVTVWPEGASEGVSLWVGKMKQASPSVFYARISDAGVVCTVGEAVLPLIGLKAETVRDRRVCTANPARLTSVTVSDRDKKLVLEHPAGEDWLLVEPIRSRAEPRAVGALLKTVCGWKGDELSGEAASNAWPRVTRDAPLKLALAEAPVTRPDAGTNGLPGHDAARQRWTLLLEPDSVSNACLVFRQEDQTLFRMASSDVARVFHGLSGPATANAADPLGYMDRGMLDVAPDHVRRITRTESGREETLVRDAGGAWTVDSPPGGQLNEPILHDLMALVTDLKAQRIESVATTNTTSYGFDEASPRLTFGLTGTSGILKTIVLGKADARGDIYAMVQGQDMVFVLPRQVAETLTRSLVTTP